MLPVLRTDQHNQTARRYGPNEDRNASKKTPLIDTGTTPDKDTRATSNSNTMVLVQPTSKYERKKLSDTILPQIPERLSPGLVVAHLVNAILLLIVLQAAVSFHNAIAAMAFYGVYHSHPVNQLIHFFGVPLLLWTVIIFQAHLPLSSRVVVPQGPGLEAHYVSWATISVIFYAVSYLRMDLIGGALYLFIWYAMYASAVYWTAQDQQQARRTLLLWESSKDTNNGKNKAQTVSWTGTGRVLQYAALAHLLAWYVQIHPGHRIFEGGQPALMQSLGGALYSAPLFAFYEGIWLIGLRPQFQQQVMALVADYTRELCEAGAAMRVCQGLVAKTAPAMTS